MKKLNNKGMTSIELLVCFILVSAIVISMFDMIMNYKNKEQIESIRNEVVQYGNSLQKMVQDDLIKGHISDATLDNNNNNKSITFLVDNPQIEDQSGFFRFTIYPTTDEQPGSISYGDYFGSLIQYPIPTIEDLKLSEESYVTKSDTFLIIVLYLEHPNFNKPYRIRITAPINYPKS